jgi:hypothetical protein
MNVATTKIQGVVAEGSRVKILVDVYNLDDAVVQPISLAWTLTDIVGSIINDRQDISVSNPTVSQPIILYGKDLEVTELVKKGHVQRLLYINATYSESGVTIPYTHQYLFVIENLVGATPITPAEKLAMDDDLSMPDDLEML